MRVTRIGGNVARSENVAHQRDVLDIVRTGIAGQKMKSDPDPFDKRDVPVERVRVERTDRFAVFGITPDPSFEF